MAIRQPQAHQLLSTNYTTTQRQPSSSTPLTATQQPAAPGAPVQPKAPENDLFSLDFHAPAPAGSSTFTTEAPKKDVKQDILSLFSSPPPASAPTPTFGTIRQSQQVWGQPPQQPAVSLMGATAWGAPVAPSSQTDLWATQQNLFNTSTAWGASPADDPFGTSALRAQAKKDDVFGDLWGESK